VPDFSDVSAYDTETHVGVYDSTATRRFYRQMGFNYPSVLKSWKVFLTDLGLEYNDFNRIDEIVEYDMLILPFTSCLSDYEAQKIREFVATGGKLFMTGTVGSRFEDGSWRDEPVFGDLVGARFVGNANPSPQGPARLSLNRDLPVSLRWTLRGSLVIPSYNEVLVIRPIGTRMNVVARAPFYRGDDSYDELVAICYGPYLKGRVAWSGVRIGALPVGDETAERAFRELFSNLIGWLGDHPRITTPTWPNRKEAALGILVDPSGSSPLRILSKIKQFDQPIALLVNPKQAREFANVPGIEHLNIEWVLHVEKEYLKIIQNSESSVGIGGIKSRIERALKTEVSGVLVDNMRPRDVARIALEAGFLYMLAPPTDGIDEYPEIYASMREMGPLEAPDVLSLAPFRKSIPQKISPTDCFFVLLDAQAFLDMEFSSKFLGIDVQNDLWVTYPKDIVGWRSDRNSVIMDKEFLPDERLRIRISNGSYSEFENFPFTIDFGNSIKKVLIWPKAVGQAPPELLSKRNGGWSYIIDRFSPGMTLEFIFTPLAENDLDK
jgi:hypothetical protein